MTILIGQHFIIKEAINPMGKSRSNTEKIYHVEMTDYMLKLDCTVETGA